MESSGERMMFTPPAMARSHSPASRLCRALCTATSEDEHAVSSTRLGPRRSSAYDTRPAVTARSRHPAALRMVGPSERYAVSAYSAVAWPTNTPLRLPASAEGRIPAASSASHTTCSRMRCWGSMVVASTGEMPKKPASKANGSSRNPPCRETVFPGVSGCGS